MVTIMYSEKEGEKANSIQDTPQSKIQETKKQERLCVA